MKIIRTTAQRRRNVRTIRDTPLITWDKNALSLYCRNWDGAIWENYYVELDTTEIAQLLEAIAARAGTPAGKALDTKLKRHKPALARLLAAAHGMIKPAR